MTPAGAPLGPAQDEDDRDAELLAALPTHSKNREVKVGLFVVIGIVSFLVALFSLTDVGTFRGRYYVTTVVENARGLRNGDPAQMRGVNIGRVSSFQMVPEGVAIRLEIFNRYRIPEDSRVVLRSAGMLGGMIVDVVPGVSEERVARNQTLPGTVEGDLLSSLGDLGPQAEELMTRANALLAPETVDALGTSAQELEVLLRDLSALAAAQRQDLSVISQSLRRSAAGIERTTNAPELERAIANVDTLTARLALTTQSLREASDRANAATTSLNNVMGRVERGEGSLGLLLNDEDLYENLNATALSLRELIRDIQANPRRYLDISVF